MFPAFDAAASPLEILYRHYAETAADASAGSGSFTELETRLASLPSQAQEAILQTVCALCETHERAAFEAGVKAGVQLSAALS